MIISKLSTGLFVLLLALTFGVGSVVAQGVDSVSGCGDVDPDSGTPVVGSQQCSSGGSTQAQSSAQSSQPAKAGAGVTASDQPLDTAEATPQAPAAQAPTSPVAVPDDRDGVVVAQALQKLSVLANAVGSLFKALA